MAARLLDAGDDVALLAHPALAEGLCREGLRIRQESATRTYRPPVLTAPELEPDFDLVVLAVKSDAIAGAIADVAPAVGPLTAGVPFLNGMRHVEPLVSRFGSAALGGVLRIATEVEDDGAIAFKAAGARVTIPPDIVGAMWTNWVEIASIGATTSLMRASVGDIVAVPGGAAFSESILDEAAATAAAAGHPVPSTALTADPFGPRLADHLVAVAGPDGRSGPAIVPQSVPVRRAV